MARRKTIQNGFTFIEVLLIMVVVAILSAIVVPRLADSATKAKSAACDANVASINREIERWYINNGSFPAQDLSNISADPEYFPEGIPKCPVDGTAYTMDTTINRVAKHTHTTGGGGGGGC